MTFKNKETLKHCLKLILMSWRKKNGKLNDDLSTFDEIEIHTFVNACLSCFVMWQSREIERLKTKRKNKQTKERNGKR
jgi:hypothetical protein